MLVVRVSQMVRKYMKEYFGETFCPDRLPR